MDKNIREKIIRSASLKKSDIVLEIGPGRGELTALLLEKVKKVIAVEIDPSLCAILKDKFSSSQNFELINQDILEFNPSLHSRGAVKVKVVANLPYYISTPIIIHLLEHREIIKDIYLTLQKELAGRLAAQPGSKEYGSISCFVQFYSDVKILFPIKNTSFWPIPKVDSSFIKLKIRSKPKVKVSDEQLFFKLVRSAFGQRRKSIKNSLSSVLPGPLLTDCLKSARIKPSLRAEDLSLADFARLANCIIK